MMGSSLISGLAFLLFVAGVFIYAVIIYNGLIRLRNENDRAWANIDVLLKQRHDEIPNLVETVKGYLQHEQQTLLAVTQARAASMNAATIGQKPRPTCWLPALCAAFLRWPRIILNSGPTRISLSPRTGSLNWRNASPTAARSSTTMSTPTTPASVRSPTSSSPAS